MDGTLAKTCLIVFDFGFKSAVSEGFGQFERFRSAREGYGYNYCVSCVFIHKTNGLRSQRRVILIAIDRGNVIYAHLYAALSAERWGQIVCLFKV